MPNSHYESESVNLPYSCILFLKVKEVKFFNIDIELYHFLSIIQLHREILFSKIQEIAKNE